MKVTCPQCNVPCDYSHQVILTLLVKGLADTELQQDLLTEADLDLDKCAKMAVARETELVGKAFLFYKGNLKIYKGK